MTAADRTDEDTREDCFPAEIVDQMRRLGLFGVTIPESYGGLGLDRLTYIGSSRSWRTAG